MGNQIDVCYDEKDYERIAPESFVLLYLEEVLKILDLSNVEFSVSFIDEKHMHDLNFEYRNIDDSTDILSFAAEDTSLDDVPFISLDENRILGDILICPEVLERNAKTFGVPVNEELRRLLIHGVLHLSGENHTTNDPSEPMLIKQEKILSLI